MASLVTNAELAAFMKVEESDLDATQATQAGDLASAAVRSYCSRQFVQATDATFSVYSPGWAIILPESDVTVTEITQDDTVLDADSYRVDSRLGLVYRSTGGWWSGDIVVTYDHDSAAPDDVKLATLQVAARIMDNPLLLQSENAGNYGSVFGINVIQAGMLTDADKALLRPHRVPVIA